MNSEEKILPVLETVNGRLERIEGDVSDLRIGQAKKEAPCLFSGACRTA